MLNRALRRNEVDITADSSSTPVLLASIDDTIALATMENDAHAGELLKRQARAAAARRALGMDRTRGEGVRRGG